MSTVLFAGQPCLDPNTVRDACVRFGLPTWWVGRANSFTNVLGCDPGTGWVLLSRGDLDVIDLNAEHALTLIADAEIGGRPVSANLKTVTQAQLHIVDTVQLTPGRDGDSAAGYLVELADRRRLMRARPINARYNVRSTPGGAFVSSTCNPATLDGSGNPIEWTWEDLIGAVWEIIGTSYLGAWPGLPALAIPAGTPEAFIFEAMPAIDALAVLLDRVGCALCRDCSGTFSVVQLDTGTSALAVAAAARSPLRVLDELPLLPVLGRVPAYVQVFFPIQRQSTDPDSTVSWHGVLVADPDGTLEGADTSGVAFVRDELPAVFAGATLQNASDLSARADERAADYFRRARGARFRRTYGLPLPDAGLQPGSDVRAARHGDRGLGMVLEGSRYDAVATGGGDPLWRGMDGDGDGPPGGPGDTTNVYNNSSFWSIIYYLFNTYLTTIILNIFNTIIIIFGGGAKFKGPLWLDYIDEELADQEDDYEPTDPAAPQPVVRLATLAGTDLTGWVPELDTGSGQLLFYTNTSGDPVVFKHEDASSAPANRFWLPQLQDLHLRQYEGEIFWYDVAENEGEGRWKVFTRREWKFYYGVWLHYATITLASASTNDLTPSEVKVVYRLDTAAGADITGWVAVPDGGSGQLMALTNISVYDITLKHDDVASAAGNRFLCPLGLDFTLGENEGCWCWYDPTSEAWRVIARNDAAGGGTPTFSAARIFRDTNQTISNATYTAVSFSDGVYFTAGMYDVGAPTKLVAVHAGVHSFGGHVTFDAGTGVEDLGVFLYVNGVEVEGQSGGPVLGGGMPGATRKHVSSQLALEIGDEVELYVFQRSGGNLDILADQNSFWMCYEGAAP